MLNQTTGEMIGYYLKSLRLKKGLTGKDVGSLLNVSQQQISRYECGLNNITFVFLLDYLKVLDVSFEDFFYYFLDNFNNDSKYNFYFLN